MWNNGSLEREQKLIAFDLFISSCIYLNVIWNEICECSLHVLFGNLIECWFWFNSVAFFSPNRMLYSNRSFSNYLFRERSLFVDRIFVHLIKSPFLREIIQDLTISSSSQIMSIQDIWICTNNKCLSHGGIYPLVTKENNKGPE